MFFNRIPIRTIILFISKDLLSRLCYALSRELKNVLSTNKILLPQKKIQAQLCPQLLLLFRSFMRHVALAPAPHLTCISMRPIFFCLQEHEISSEAIADSFLSTRYLFG